MAKDDKNLTQNLTANVNQFLSQANKTPLVKTSMQRGRLLFAMDATASREPSWAQARQIQGQMFQQTAALGTLDIQLCYYRGMQDFYASQWISQSDVLLQQMSAVQCLGGHTQIQRVLRHALQEAQQNKINALVFVGDCVEENSDDICHAAGQLALHNVPIFVFHEGYDIAAAQVFKQMANLTRGTYCSFDANSAQQLRDLLSAVAVYAVGGRAALEDFHRRKGKVILSLSHQQNK